MKLPSIEQVYREAITTFRRFPIVLLVAAAGTIAAIILIARDNHNLSSSLFGVMMAAGLGISLLFALAVLAEKNRLKWLIQGAGVLAVILYGWTIPGNLLNSPLSHMIRFQMLLIATHLFAAIAPFLSCGRLNGFWQYNRILFFRFLTSALFSGVLFAGLAIALVALDKLFGVDIKGERYLQLWVLIAGLFNTWFFLAGIPEDIEALVHETEYPKVLKVFGQYILLPLVLVYFVILYAYIAKILIQWNWPKGWVSGLILGFSSSGLFSLLLLFPIRELPGQLWIKKAWRLFFIVIIPLIPVLFLAGWQRVSQYGITESRYVLFACVFWLAAAALYFNLSKAKSIKFIPISLGLIALAISFGPWGALAVSENSQIARLKQILARNEILADAKVQHAPSAVPYEDAKQISSIVEYLRSFHGYERIQPWFAQNLRTDSTYNGSNYIPADSVTGFMGVRYVSRWEQGDAHWQALKVDRTHAINIAGYERILRDRRYDGVKSFEIMADSEACLSVSKGMDTLTFVVMRHGERTDSIVMYPRLFMRQLQSDHAGALNLDLPPESLSIAAENDRLKLLMILDNVAGLYGKDSTNGLTCSYDLLYTVRRD